MESQGGDMSPPAQPNTGASRASRMSPARLARKRKADRESQKASRLKQKNYIAHLEALVKSLDASAGSDPVELLKQQGAENVEIKKALTTICKIAQTALGVSGGDSRYMGTSSSPDPMTDQADVKDMKPDPPKLRKIQPSQTAKLDFDTDPVKSMGESEATIASVADVHPHGAGFPSMFTEDDANLGEFIHHDLLDFTVREPGAQQTFDASELLCTREALSMAQAAPGSWAFAPLSESLPLRTHHPDSGGRDWVSTVNLLTTPVVFPLESPEDALDGDIPISAVLRGWDAVETRRPLDPGWKVLREIDQNLFIGCGIAERLAVLRIMRLMCHYMTTAERRPELPPFMLKRPCQEHIKHHPMIDYLVWPGLRERLIFSQQKFAANADRYTELFRTNFRFLWPFEPEDIYYRDPETGRYAFSEQFIGRTEDLSCWTMHNDYFIALPELRGDIPGFPQTSIYTLSQQPPVSQQAVQRKPLPRSGDSQESSQNDKCSVNIDFPHAMWGRMSQVS
ncbi:uncharacterized protein PV07_01707 [Cladophialophora immunda]|uniref:BZIP domain-containing protein n=1 Tax=Cladophialophora immunda TaxID=569365 RepID=A0A0D2CV44_9EURO|nr:uncharacterized protein PV07_01707 [Cladophialophora immunda]KIW34978.1 hypothetical protein PV07_01707 [Cladophialophora immunda]OQV06098.1 hypothetical protein CLAIMM_10726 isoform 1 [Cladophialophora immunda]